MEKKNGEFTDKEDFTPIPLPQVDPRPEMSEVKEVVDKNCPNCQTTITGKYCSTCGQETITPTEVFWQFIRKFFRTIKYLITKPGFLSFEYKHGRKARYLRPFRMYIYTSTIFFLMFFAITQLAQELKSKEIKPYPAGPGEKITTEYPLSLTDLKRLQAKLEDSLKKEKIPDIRRNIGDAIKDVEWERRVIGVVLGDTTKRLFGKEERNIFFTYPYRLRVKDINAWPDRIYRDLSGKDIRLDGFWGKNNFLYELMDIDLYPTVAVYDSLQRALPESLKDDWYSKLAIRKYIYRQKKYHWNINEVLRQAQMKWLQVIPKVAMLSLPIVSLLLKLIYLSKKRYSYTDHFIFSIHLYCTMFMLSVFYFLLILWEQYCSMKWHTLFKMTDYIYAIVALIYCYIALRRFYQEGIGRTMLKYLLLFFLAVIINFLLWAIAVYIDVGIV